MTMRILLVDDDDGQRALFIAETTAEPTPWMRDVVLEDRATPLENIHDYYNYDAAIFDLHLKLYDTLGDEITGLRVCQLIHAYQYQRDDDGNRVHKECPTALMLLTGEDYSQIPINARDCVDQIAYKHGTGARHVDDSLGCSRAILRSIDRNKYCARKK